MAFLKVLYHIGKGVAKVLPKSVRKYLPQVDSYEDFADGKKEAQKMNAEMAENAPIPYAEVKTVYLMIHGINTIDAGASTTAKFRHSIQRQGDWPEVIGYRWVILPSNTNKVMAKYVAERIEFHKNNGKKVVVIGHSNGCAIMDRASHLRKVDNNGVVIHADAYCYLNPAVKRNRAPEGVNFFLVWHSHDDDVVGAARIYSKYLRRFLNFRPWGSMGRDGYQGNATNRVNFKYSKSPFNPTGSGHSGIFNKFSVFEPLVLDSCKEALVEIRKMSDDHIAVARIHDNVTDVFKGVA